MQFRIILSYKPEGVQEDSANLKEKIELALNSKATIEDIESGNI
jgi:hypothetical protein